MMNIYLMYILLVIGRFTNLALATMGCSTTLNVGSVVPISSFTCEIPMPAEAEHLHDHDRHPSKRLTTINAGQQKVKDKNGGKVHSSRPLESMLSLSGGSTHVMGGSGGSSSIVDVSLEDFQRTVLDADKPIIIDVHATWCGPCKQLAPMLQKAVKDHQKGPILVAKINADQCPSLVETLGVTGFPTLFAMNRKGQILGKLVGLPPAATLDALMNFAALSGHSVSPNGDRTQLLVPIQVPGMEDSTSSTAVQELQRLTREVRLLAGMSALTFQQKQSISAGVQKAMLLDTAFETTSKQSRSSSSSSSSKSLLKYSVGVRMVMKMVGNCMRDIHNVKYRQLKLTNPALASSVLSNPAAMQLLKEAGFVEKAASTAMADRIPMLDRKGVKGRKSAAAAAEAARPPPGGILVLSHSNVAILQLVNENIVEAFNARKFGKITGGFAGRVKKEKSVSSSSYSISPSSMSPSSSSSSSMSPSSVSVSLKLGMNTGMKSSSASSSTGSRRQSVGLPPPSSASEPVVATVPRTSLRLDSSNQSSSSSSSGDGDGDGGAEQESLLATASAVSAKAQRIKDIVDRATKSGGGNNNRENALQKRHMVSTAAVAGTTTTTTDTASGTGTATATDTATTARSTTSTSASTRSGFSRTGTSTGRNSAKRLKANTLFSTGWLSSSASTSSEHNEYFGGDSTVVSAAPTTTTTPTTPTTHVTHVTPSPTPTPSPSPPASPPASSASAPRQQQQEKQQQREDQQCSLTDHDIENILRESKTTTKRKKK